jgi:acetolactate synthase-1/2/3 large subunit
MLGMHGTVAANYAVDRADLLLAVGVRFDDRVTGKLEAFAARARIVHIDIDPAEINKNKASHVTLTAPSAPALAGLADLLAAEPIPEGQYAAWRAELVAKATEFPLPCPQRDDVVVPQAAIALIAEETRGEAIISTGVGQHQMWAAQWYRFDAPRRWVTSGGLGAMGFGLPSALGAAAAWDGSCPARPARTVIDIDGDGSFVMNIQELATAKVEGLAVKTVILNNQHLGMVVQWEDRFYKANRAHTYLGSPDGAYHETGDLGDVYPDFVGVAKAFGVPAERVVRPADLRAAVRRMLDTPGPYVLDIMVPHVEHVLPMIPGGGSFADVITTGDGTDTY